MKKTQYTFIPSSQFQAPNKESLTSTSDSPNQRRSIAQRKACGMASLREAAPTLRATQERLTRYRFSTRRYANAIGLLYIV
ncbi:hypothetical protein [Nostoc sp. FACHB-892]|uniref:hypothetical protein n=1 Tax=Nostoc sp. FACHB-892 TaxID=2692843 RepID=UPI001689B4ED|nr:hypothetical protein [Nostoc sp. FACHB-892]